MQPPSHETSTGLGSDIPFVDELNFSDKPPTIEEVNRQSRRHIFDRFIQSKDYKLPEPKRDFRFKQPLKRGWLLPYLLDFDHMFWGRWDYWAAMKESGQLSENPIPKIEWASISEQCRGTGHRALIHALNQITPSGHWHSWGTWDNFSYFLDWLLFGFGHPGQMEEPPEPRDGAGASARLYQAFNLAPLMLYPGDYLGSILAENAHGRHLAFYPTPMALSSLMATMIAGSEDIRTKSFCDCCVGTGRLLLAASNHSLRLYGQDVNPVVIKVTLVNGYMYAPWLVKPLDFLSREDAAYNDPRSSSAISDQLALLAAADPKASAYCDWSQTEHDPDIQPLVHPIKVRRPKGTKSKLVQYEMNLDPCAEKA